MSDGDMVLLLPDGRSVGLDLDAARSRLLRLGDANGEDPVPVLRAGRLAGEPARDAYYTAELALLALAPGVGDVPVRLVEGPFAAEGDRLVLDVHLDLPGAHTRPLCLDDVLLASVEHVDGRIHSRSEEHTSELQSPDHLVC